MLGKLIKYDFKWIFKVVLIYIVLGLSCAALGRVFSLIENSVIFGIISAILKSVSGCLLVSSLINGILRGWARLVSNQYKDESYLVNTLPIDRKTLLLSKIISTIITITSSFICIVIGLIIAYYNENTLEIIKESLSSISDTLNTSIVSFVIVVILVLFLEILFLVFVGFFGIVFGHKFNQKKMLKSLLSGLVVYVVASNLSLLIMFIASMFNDSLSGLLFGNTFQIELSILKGLMLGAVFIYLVYCVVLYIITNKILSKGINID